MDDKDFLIWLHERLVYQHCESANVDFMHKLRAIIRDTPSGKITPNRASSPQDFDIIT